MKEFAIIDDFFKSRSYQRKDVILGIGDDCALTQVPEGQSLAITTDTLVSGVHFLPDDPADAIAHKAIAANLSDLAAMGAEPAWLSLSLSLPDADPVWLDAFSNKIKELTDYYSLQLIGGDTVRGALTVTITAQGFVPEGQGLTRSQAKPGDWLYVTGNLGDAALGLDIALGKVSANQNHQVTLLRALHYPTARLLAGTLLRRVANACIDISDGLLADLGHILKASNCGANVYIERLPLSKAMLETVDSEQARRYALNGGDDYELLFSVSEEQKGSLDTVLSNYNVAATCIGQLTGSANKINLQLDGQVYRHQGKGYEHFA